MIFINTVCNKGSTKLNTWEMLFFSIDEIDVTTKVEVAFILPAMLAVRSAGECKKNNTYQVPGYYHLQVI